MWTLQVYRLVMGAAIERIKQLTVQAADATQAKQELEKLVIQFVQQEHESRGQLIVVADTTPPQVVAVETYYAKAPARRGELSWTWEVESIPIN